MTTIEKYNCHRRKKLSFSEGDVQFLIPIIITLNSDPDLQVLRLNCRIASLLPFFLNLCLKEGSCSRALCVFSGGEREHS